MRMEIQRKWLISRVCGEGFTGLHRRAGVWQSMRTRGWIAQSVEQRTENPCVASSILAPATTFQINRNHAIETNALPHPGLLPKEKEKQSRRWHTPSML